MKKKQKTNVFRTIQGKIIELGSIAFIGILILGLVGVYGIRRNNNNSDIETSISEINQLQGKNEAADSMYIYYLEQVYLDTITNNLDKMKLLSEEIEKTIDSKFDSDMNQMQESIEKNLANYQQIIPLCNERGFSKAVGLYAQYLSNSDTVHSQLQQLMNDNSWAETKWTAIEGDGKTVKIGNKEYIKITYSSKLPEVGKRDVFVARIGGTGYEYKKDIYIDNIYLKKGDVKAELDLSALTDSDLASSYGDALQEVSIAEFNKNAAIHVKANFTSSREMWEEISVKMPITALESQEYDTIYYDLYMEVPVKAGLQIGGAVTDIFDFTKAHTALIEAVDTYSKLVNEGKAVEDNKTTIQGAYSELEANLAVYSINESLKEEILNNIKVEQDCFNEMQRLDTTLLDLKSDNAELSKQLTEKSTSIKETIKEDMDSIQAKIILLIVIVLVITAICIIVITFVIGKGIRGSIISFKKMLGQVTAGNISVRADVSKGDEFSQFGQSLNVFLDKLAEVILSLQKVSKTLIQSGLLMEEKAQQTNGVADTIASAISDISQGAIAQAEDITISSGEIATMGDMINQIIEKVSQLSTSATKMKQQGDESLVVVQELGESSNRTTSAFDKIATQIRVTDDSVRQIRTAINLITSIADETNLLSLNASIEAARAGEAGRGFAVVATEIQKLAEQSNSSAKIIDSIITKLTEESQTTVQYVEQITAIVEEQKEKLEETNERFLEVSNGIQSSGEQMKGIIAQANDCNTSREKTIEVITNLSAISEENAASTEQTNSSMQELNEASIVLADTASQFKVLSIELQKDLAYFSVETEV
ncbi:HAMP domain-containing methyl-accepting chemotaxis protein [Anaerosporobacter sp.]|uniref:HAMP domain-containing methyl-accepting chemotaxis protein n=1 Tax=Anaerosporobacter sp. TaxID=1872529 RepID=UPI00286ED52E|nr:methyl-accepting chemotaxis protein [Anaerosporobacter sp.]